MFFGEPEPVFNSPEISPPWPNKFSPHRPRECVHCFNIFFTTVFSWCRGCSFFFGEGNILENSQYYGTFRTKAESGQENFPKADSPCWFPAMDQPHGSRDFPHGRPGHRWPYGDSYSLLPRGRVGVVRLSALPKNAGELFLVVRCWLGDGYRFAVDCFGYNVELPKSTGLKTI